MPARKSISQRRCAALAKIVNGTPAVVNRTCLIQTLRSDIKPRIQGRRTRSPLVLPVFFSVEKSKGKKRTLNLGEAVLRQARGEQGDQRPPQAGHHGYRSAQPLAV